MFYFPTCVEKKKKKFRHTSNLYCYQSFEMQMKFESRICSTMDSNRTRTPNGDYMRKASMSRARSAEPLRKESTLPVNLINIAKRSGNVSSSVAGVSVYNNKDQQSNSFSTFISTS